ncbi:MAG: DJ-1/PfpI family protein [Gemmatimonadota bacterium]
MAAPRHVCILIFEDAEVLDVAGPFEVFSIAGRRDGLDPFRVTLAAGGTEVVTLRNGFRVTPHYSLAECPPIDILLVPGGPGSRRESGNPHVIEWIRDRAERCELLLSVCSGALILAATGMLDGLEITTHASAMPELARLAPNSKLREGVRFTDNGRILLSAGVSAGLDMSLEVVARLLGEDLAEEAAHYMEYHWNRNETGLPDVGL